MGASKQITAIQHVQTTNSTSIQPLRLDGKEITLPDAKILLGPLIEQLSEERRAILSAVIQRAELADKALSSLRTLQNGIAASIETASNELHGSLPQNDSPPLFVPSSTSKPIRKSASSYDRGEKSEGDSAKPKTRKKKGHAISDSAKEIERLVKAIPTALQENNGSLKSRLLIDEVGADRNNLYTYRAALAKLESSEVIRRDGAASGTTIILIRKRK